MSNQKITTKKLKAIVFTDIVNFTSISAKDEQVALDLIQKQNDIIKPIVEKYNGEWLKEIGDGLLLSFGLSWNNVEVGRKLYQIETNEMPTPYLDGVFDSILAEEKRVKASFETNRGCPFKCAFCDWGGQARSKVTKFDMDPLKVGKGSWM